MLRVISDNCGLTRDEMEVLSGIAILDRITGRGIGGKESAPAPKTFSALIAKGLLCRRIYRNGSTRYLLTESGRRAASIIPIHCPVHVSANGQTTTLL